MAPPWTPDDSSSPSRLLVHAARDRALRSLARDAVHDLKGALNVISMTIELLSRAGTERVPSSGTPDRYVNVIRRELRGIERSVDILLNGCLEDCDTPQPFDLAGMCELVVGQIAARASRQRIAVTLAPPGGAAEIRGFPDLIHTALLVVAVNALDAMPDGGDLHLVLSKAPLIQIELRDSGPGIAPELLPDVWQPAVTTKPGASGIGLHVAKSIVESHGGTIEYQPNPGGGSCFVLTFPPAVYH